MEIKSVSQRDVDEFLLSLLRLDTTNPPGNERLLATNIIDYLYTYGLKESMIEMVSHGEDRNSFTISLPGKDIDRTVGFAGHMDTVPLGEPENWTQDPFGTQSDDGYIYGRGAADMKGGLTAMVFLCRQFLTKVPPVNLRFFFTSDEESGGLGVTELRKSGAFDDIDFLIICEPTNCKLGICVKGMLWTEFSFYGKSSHAALAEQGVNALELGIDYLLVLKERIKSLSPTHPLLGKNSFTMSKASAGIKINVVPDRADLSADIRLIPSAESNIDAVKTLILKSAEDYKASHAGLNIKLHFLDSRDSISTPRDNPYISCLYDSTEKMLCPAEFCGINYFTDGALVIPYFDDLPFCILGPGDPEECHTPDEKILPSAISDVLAIYSEFLNSL